MCQLNNVTGKKEKETKFEQIKELGQKVNTIFLFLKENNTVNTADQLGSTLKGVSLKFSIIDFLLFDHIIK